MALPRLIPRTGGAPPDTCLRDSSNTEGHALRRSAHPQSLRSAHTLGVGHLKKRRPPAPSMLEPSP
jgi:hypothetical protein